MPPCCVGRASKRRPSGPSESPRGMSGRSDSCTYRRKIAATKPYARGTLSLRFPMPHVPFLWPASLAPPLVSSSPQS